MKQVFKKGFFYLMAFSMVLGNSVLSIDFSIPIANAISVENPQFVEGNPSCNSLGYDNEYKITPGDPYTYEPSEASNFVSISNLNGGQFDWSSTINIDAVIAKGGDNANVYSYDPASTGGSGLVTPLNGGDQIPNLSHVSFCYNDPVDCQLVVTKEYDGGPVAPGDQITYSLSITNNGTDDCTLVRLKDYFDIDNISYVIADPVPYNAGYYYDYLGWDYGTMESGESHQVSLTMEVKEDTCGSTIKNVAKSLSHELGWTADMIVETPIVCNEEEPEYYNIKASKVVCESEEDLPNWGDHQSVTMIDSDTAADYVSKSEGNCWLEEDWAFQWGTDVSDAGRDFVGAAGSGWNNFDTTTGSGTMAEVLVEANDLDVIKVREVLPEGYIPFAWNQGYDDDGTDDNVSAEIYCYDDVLNYDNYDFVRNPEVDNTYYCVAFNVLAEVDECTLDSDNYNETLDIVDIGDTASEAFHSISGWSAANIPGGYGGCQNGVVCDYRQLVEDSCTENERAADTVLHAGNGIAESITIRHLDGVSLMDSFEIYINDQLVDTWLDETQISSEVWLETSFDISSYGFTGDLNVKLKAIDPIWNLCSTYGQVAIDWISLQGCGDTWEAHFCGNYEQEGDEQCDDGPNGSIFCTNECTLIEQPPICYEEGESFFASTVESYDQGQKKDGSNVDANRSIPEQGLELELGNNVSNFFSLGFGGWTIVSFDEIFVDGPGNDIKITEDTWGAYSLEKADVYVSQDGTTWVFLGTANNLNSVNSTHTTSEFDLASTGLTWGQYVKVVDTSDASVHSATADGYDLNAIEALSGGYIGECKEVITVCKVDEQQNPLSGWEMTLYGSNLVTNGSFEYPTVTSNSGQWQLFTPAEVDWSVDWINSHDGNPVLEYQTNLLGLMTPYEGSQYAELGSNFATKISQDINTIAGADYQLGFAFAPRNGSPEGINGDNQLQVKFGSIDETINADAGYTWTYHIFNSSAVDPSTTLEFIDTGFDNSYGTFVDNVTLRQVATGVTGEDGCVEFEVPYDTYEVREILQEGWTQVYPEDPDYFTVDFNEENNAPVVTFVNKENTDEPTYDVHGYKWEDINGNGLRDCEFLVSAAVVDLQTPISECEPLLSGWTMNIYEGESSTPLMTMDTSSETEHFGWYWFEGLSAGDYRICEELKNGWQQTYPEDCHLITLPSEFSVQQTLNAVLAPEYNFGNQQLVEEKTYCGDGAVQTPNDEGTGGPENDGNEQCDTEGQACTTEDGYVGTQSCNMSSDESQALACTWNTCVSEYYCGDGLLQANVEGCDDGNKANGDGCSSSCTNEGGTITTTSGGGGGGGPVIFSIQNLNANVSCSGVDLTWLTSKASDTILNYGTVSETYTTNINNDTNATGHSLTLTGLLPGTTYYYQVSAIDSTNKEIKVVEKSFTTLPAEQCGAVLGEKIEAPLFCDFLRASGSSGVDKDMEGVTEFANGSLLRDACDRLEAVYLIKDQMKWHVPSWKYLHDNHFGQRIYNVLSSVINGYPNWTAKVLGVKDYADGTLLRGPDMKIYIIKDGKAKHISTLQELFKYAGQEIINVSQEVIDKY